MAALLGFTPWKVVMEAGSAGTSVVVSRNGRTVDSAIVRADVLGPGMPTANPDLLVAAFVLMTIADGYEGRAGFDGLLEARSWTSIGLVASTQREIATPSVTGAADRRRILAAAALLEDNPFTRTALQEHLYRDSDDVVVQEGYARALLAQAARIDDAPETPGERASREAAAPVSYTHLTLPTIHLV